jgi:hypothetical protein
MVHLYTLCWNEVDMLGFFFRHYDSWVDRYVVYDDGSTDGSIDVLARHPRVEVRRFHRTHPESFVLSHQVLHNEAWKESRGQADWVVVTALDEHLHVGGSTMSDYLACCARLGVTAVPAFGYQMISESYPPPDAVLCSALTWGAPWSLMDKLSIFNPDAVAETGFEVGRHQANPQGDIRWPARDDAMLLHYKYLDFERTLERHRAQGRAIGAHDASRGWGVQYGWSAERLREEWECFKAKAVNIAQPGFEPGRGHESPPWWRVVRAGGAPGADGSTGSVDS